ncbi:hypothetical protein V8F20_009061 [Naviculisporaceae sp. PSN 640]
MNLRNLLARGVIIIWHWESESSSSSGPRTPPFEVVPKAPAGQRDTRPEFTIYMGVNTGPYNTTENGTLILPPIPIEWIVAPRVTNLSSTSNDSSTAEFSVTCPSRGDNLRLFGITNLIVSALILIIGCRPLIRILTGGLLGAPTKWSKYWTWIISMGLTIGSNALVSKLIVDTPGYEHLSMLNVFALYSSRPRINQIWTGILRLLVGPITVRGRGRVEGKRKKEVARNGEESVVGSTVSYGGGRWGPTMRPGTTAKASTAGGRYVMKIDRHGNGTWQWENPTIGTRKGATTSRVASSEKKNEGNVKWWNLARRKWQDSTRKKGNDYEYEDDYSTEEEWIYTDSYIATSIAEFVIQLISAIFIGITWRRFPNEPIRNHMQNYYNYMLAAPALSLVGWVFIPIWWKRNRGSARYAGDRVKTIDFFLCLFFLGLPGFFTYGVAWRYWAEFLLLPGSLWCPPKFIEQAAVWSSFSGLSAFSGAVM